MAPKSAKRSASKSGTPSSEKRARSSPLPEDGREAVVVIICELLQKSPQASANSRAAAEALEKSCWEQSGGNQATYQTKCKDIIDKMQSGQHWRVFVSDEQREKTRNTIEQLMQQAKKDEPDKCRDIAVSFEEKIWGESKSKEAYDAKLKSGLQSVMKLAQDGAAEDAALKFWNIQGRLVGEGALKRIEEVLTHLERVEGAGDDELHRWRERRALLLLKKEEGAAAPPDGEAKLKELLKALELQDKARKAELPYALHVQLRAVKELRADREKAAAAASPPPPSTRAPAAPPAGWIGGAADARWAALDDGVQLELRSLLDARGWEAEPLLTSEAAAPALPPPAAHLALWPPRARLGGWPPLHLALPADYPHGGAAHAVAGARDAFCDAAVRRAAAALDAAARAATPPAGVEFLAHAWARAAERQLGVV